MKPAGLELGQVDAAIGRLQLGLEVEGVRDPGAGISGVVVARVLDVATGRELMSGTIGQKVAVVIGAVGVVVGIWKAFVFMTSRPTTRGCATTAP